jgi:hypothetical protein
VTEIVQSSKKKKRPSPKQSSQEDDKSRTQTSTSETESNQEIELAIPVSLLMTGTTSGNNECTVLVCPEENFDFHGHGGSVGRFEVNNDTLIMDLKGYQYQGNLKPGPTALVCAMHPSIGDNKMKVESITDEYVKLLKTGDAMAQLDAVIEKGEVDESFQFQEENVNSKSAGNNVSSEMKGSKKDKSSRKKKKTK